MKCWKAMKSCSLGPGVTYYGYRWYDAPNARWLSHDPIEEEGGINLYAFVGNNGVDRWDILGLATILNGDGLHTSTPPSNCCFDKSGKIVDKQIDDANRECCPFDIEDIELRIAPTTPGHVWIRLPIRYETIVFAKTGKSVQRPVAIGAGFHPVNSPNWFNGPFQWISAAGRRPGQIDNEWGRDDHDPKKTQKYRACPESIKVVESIIDESRDQVNQGVLQWQLGNLRSPNCAGWALGVLKESGFRVTNDPQTPHLKPSWID
jgi:uncharacterized protein RhaS with RHS repeats